MTCPHRIISRPRRLLPALASVALPAMPAFAQSTGPAGIFTQDFLSNKLCGTPISTCCQPTATSPSTVRGGVCRPTGSERHADSHVGWSSAGGTGSPPWTQESTATCASGRAPRFTVSRSLPEPGHDRP
jgi:hypothetical protein